MNNFKSISISLLLIEVEIELRVMVKEMRRKKKKKFGEPRKGGGSGEVAKNFYTLFIYYVLFSLVILALLL